MIGALIITWLASSACAQAPVSEHELFSDVGFANGFLLTAASHPAPKIEIGIVQKPGTDANALPQWRMPQWGTRYLLEPGCMTSCGEGKCAKENSAKRIALEQLPGGPAALLLEVLGSVEYGGKLRASGEAWPHLLIEQAFPSPLRLDTMNGLRFHMEMRVEYCRCLAEIKDKLDPGLHTAQVSAFWTVHNLSANSPDAHEMIWFGIPLFDARYEIPPAHYALDTGKSDATGKFICLLDGKRFWNGPTGDGQWRTLDTDLIPLLREALAISQQHGYLKNTRPEDLGITSFNLGWEIPGPYDAAIQLRGLSMKSQTQ